VPFSKSVYIMLKKCSCSGLKFDGRTEETAVNMTSKSLVHFAPSLNKILNF
jgi:hypothetical protein